MTSMTSSGEGHTMYLYRRVVTSRTGGTATAGSRRGTVLSGSAQVLSVDPFWAQVSCCYTIVQFHKLQLQRMLWQCVRVCCAVSDCIVVFAAMYESLHAR
jgi:hypothetical protein